MKRTHLHDFHISAKAKMLPFGGWDMPIQYTAIKDEVEAVRNNVGMFDTSHMGIAMIEGDEHLKLVQYFQTNNIMSAPEGKAVYGLICNPSGGVIDDLISYKVSSDYTLICVNAGNTDNDYSVIQSCIKEKSFNANLIPYHEYAMVALQGPKSYETLLALSFFQENHSKSLLSSMKKMNVLQVDDIFIASSGYTGEKGYEIFAPKAKMRTIWTELDKMGVQKCGLGARDVLRIEAAFPLYGHELTTEISPFDADLGKFVDMNKSDFLGKQALEKRPLKFKRILFSVSESIPRQGFEIILENKVVGHVTSGTFCAKLNCGIGMGLVEEGCSFSEKSLMIRVRNREIAAKIHQRNFLTIA